MPLDFKYSMHSVKGNRKAMEDVSFVQEFNGIMLGMFDGHGGSLASTYAAQSFTDRLSKHLSDGLTVSAALTNTFLAIDQDIQRKGIQDGTTCTVGLVNSTELVLANVGDTRAILIRDQDVLLRTRDHKVTDPGELQRYRSSKWFITKSRLISQGMIKGFKLITISRSLGDAFFEDALSAVPDITSANLQEGDTLVIATDGLWNFVSEEQVQSILESGTDMHQLPKTLVEAALEKNSSDNISVIVLQAN